MPLATESQLTLEVVWFGLGWFGPRPGAVWCSLLRFVAFLFDNRQHIGITNLQHRSSAAHQTCDQEKRRHHASIALTLDHPQRDAPVLVLGKDPTAHASKDGRRCHASPDEPRHLNRIWIQSKLDHLADGWQAERARVSDVRITTLAACAKASSTYLVARPCTNAQQPSASTMLDLQFRASG
eukprot:scaffold7328_cov314-Pinguiococcus_pyrenoidosus.AAC.15